MQTVSQSRSWPLGRPPVSGLFGMLMPLLILGGWNSAIQATNGMLLPGYTARSTALGGAITAEPGSGMDLQANPSLLARTGRSSDEYGLRYAELATTYTDSLLPPDGHPVSNRSDAKMRGYLPYFGLVRFLSPDTALGFAAFVQGGGGGTLDLERRVPGGVSLAEYSRLSELPQTRSLSESLSARMGSLRAQVGGAQRLGRLSLGLSVDALLGNLRISTGYSAPGTGVHLPGSGFDYRSRTTAALGGSAGVHFQLTERLALGAAYSPQVRLSPDGDAQVGRGDPGNYRRSGVSMRQRWPAVSRAGLAYSLGNWRLMADARYIEWSRAFESMSLVFSDAWVETPFGSRSNVVAFRHQWRDQTVLAFGAERSHGPWAYRFGYNYGRMPLSPQGLNPLFGATTEHHFAVGVGRTTEALRYDLSVEYGAPRTIRGGLFSDWAVSHAVLGRDAIYLPFFKYQKRTWTGSVVIGITRTVGGTSG